MKIIEYIFWGIWSSGTIVPVQGSLGSFRSDTSQYVTFAAFHSNL